MSAIASATQGLLPSVFIYSNKSFTENNTSAADGVSILEESTDSVLPSRSLKTRSRQHKTAQTSRYYTFESNAWFTHTMQSEATSFNFAKNNFNIRWTYYTTGRCLISVMVIIAVLYYTPFVRSIRSWRQKTNSGSVKSKNAHDKAFGSVF
eukprot:NODE_122_length_18870_cov_0.236908.p12 type:complete len:151 gc:universal NODE_122_length_18870_cov_0.236908:9918-10370(+)